MRIILQGGDNMFGRAIQLTLSFQTPGDADITDSQSAKDYLFDILSPNQLYEISRANLDGNYLWGDLIYDLNENLRIIKLILLFIKHVFMYIHVYLIKII